MARCPVKKLLKRLLEAEPQPSPAGKITRAQVRQSLGFGAVAAFLVSPLSEFGHVAARAIAPIIMLDAELVLTGIGFAGGTVIALAWHLIRQSKGS